MMMCTEHQRKAGAKWLELRTRSILQLEEKIEYKSHKAKWLSETPNVREKKKSMKEKTLISLIAFHALATRHKTIKMTQNHSREIIPQS